MPIAGLYLEADPVLAISTIFYHRSLWLPVLPPAIGILAISAIFGRVFCGWACPIGFLSDISGRLARLFSKPRKWRLEGLSIGVLAAVLLGAFLSIDILSFTDPMVIFQRSSYMLWGLAGIPLIILIILAGSMLVPRLWCRLCPMGAALGLVSVFSPFGRRLNERCTGCLKCRSACPMAAISRDNRWDAVSCTRCLECERACPEGAISFSRSRPSPSLSITRRSVLAAGALLGFFAFARAAVPAGASGLIRPPGSLVESKLNAACVRCESCSKACLGQVIRPAGLDAGLERYYTPVLDFNAGKCERCGTCGTVCPTGAISGIPVADMKMGTAAIDVKKCIAWSLDKKCLICAEICPVHAVSGAGSLRPAVMANRCVGCGACQFECPAEGKAIVVSNEGERRRAI